MTPCGAFVLKHTSTVILILWVVHVGVFGNTLLGQMYRLDCEDRVVPFAVYSLLLGCLSLAIFAVFRALAGHFQCGSANKPIKSFQSQIMYFCHCASALLTLITTGLCYAAIYRSSCNEFDPSSAPFICACLVNFLNGFVSKEQTPCCDATSFTPTQTEQVPIIVISRSSEKHLE